MLAKVYSSVIAIVRRFVRFDDDVCFAEACDKRALIEGVIIIKCDKDVMLIKLFRSEGVMIVKSFYNEDNEDSGDVINDDVIFISYSCIKFIALFKYLTLYHVSYFES